MGQLQIIVKCICGRCTSLVRKKSTEKYKTVLITAHYVLMRCHYLKVPFGISGSHIMSSLDVTSQPVVRSSNFMASALADLKKCLVAVFADKNQNYYYFFLKEELQMNSSNCLANETSVSPTYHSRRSPEGPIPLWLFGKCICLGLTSS